MRNQRAYENGQKWGQRLGVASLVLLIAAIPTLVYILWPR